MEPENLQAQFKWPGNAKAAICFTYDDGLECHLEVVVPQLDEFGFKGTFYATGNSQSLYKRMDEWRQIKGFALHSYKNDVICIFGD